MGVLKQVFEEIELLQEENEKLKNFYNAVEMAYYSPPMDVPPTTDGDYKRVCQDVRIAIEKYRECD